MYTGVDVKQGSLRRDLRTIGMQPLPREKKTYSIRLRSSVLLPDDKKRTLDTIKNNTVDTIATRM